MGRVSTSSAIRVMSGSFIMRLPRQSPSFATPAGRSEGAMAAKFRVALSGDFKKADGSPTFPDFDLAPLRNAPGVEVAYLESANPIRADQLEDFDALILFAHRFAETSVPKSGRLAAVARFGVGYDAVDVDACTEAG